MVYDGLMRNIIAASFVVAVALAAYAVETKAPDAAVREFKSVNIEVKGNKIWTPSFFVVKKGDKVKITLINTAPSGVHAFEIEGIPGTSASVDNKEGANTKTIEFTADKAGIYRIFCPIHPGHVGGQLLVLE
jgi:nitrosocyanin